MSTEPKPGQQWKSGDELLPFHPKASHVSPEYRDGWNACFYMRERTVYNGEPVHIGAQVWMKLCNPMVRAASTSGMTRQQLGQLYAGILSGAIGSMAADFGKEQAIAWAQQTLDMVSGGDFEDLTPRTH